MFISNCLNISTTEIRMIKSLSSKVWIAIAVSSLHLCFEKSYGVKWMNSIALIIELYNSCVQKFNSWCPLTWWWGRVQVRPSMRPANMWLLAWNAATSATRGDVTQSFMILPRNKCHLAPCHHPSSVHYWLLERNVVREYFVFLCPNIYLRFATHGLWWECVHCG